jgi:hypothetical protein
MLLNHPDCPATPGVQACPIRGGRGAVEVCLAAYGNALAKFDSVSTPFTNWSHVAVAHLEGMVSTAPRFLMWHLVVWRAWREHALLVSGCLCASKEQKLTA